MLVQLMTLKLNASTLTKAPKIAIFRPYQPEARLLLSYQHHYHAGNHADVLKHWMLVSCVRYLQQKPTAFDYIDTHAGDGLYQLDSNYALKTNESEGGIGKLMQQPIPGIEDYLALVQSLYHKQHYPGSPALVNLLLRPQDKAWLFEMHPQSHRSLVENCARHKQTHVAKEDGYSGLLRLLPVVSRRALVLIDPSYEVKTEYHQVVRHLAHAYKKMPQATYLLWYPVVERTRIDALEAQLKKTSMTNVHLFEVGVKDDDEAGMSGSGMIAVNPPWTLPAQGQQILPELAKVLSLDGLQRHRYQCLVEE